MARVFIPSFPSSEATWSLQLCSQQAFDLPRRPPLEFSFLLILSFPLSFWMFFVGKGSPLLSHYPSWYPYILPTIVPL